jgi:hypothetical protein
MAKPVNWLPFPVALPLLEHTPLRWSLPGASEPIEKVAAGPFDAPKPDSKHLKNGALSTPTRVRKGHKGVFHQAQNY